MMFLDTFFKTEKTFTARIEQLNSVVTNGKIGAKEWVLIKEIPAIFWRGSMAASFISEQYRAQVDAIALVKPSDIQAIEIPQGSRLTLIYGCVEVGKFNVIYPDDIANQGECIVINLKEYKNV